jgi:Four helix bundle sensory module for signal transduction
MFQDLPRRNTMITGCVLIALIPAAIGSVGLNCLRQMSRGDQRLYDNSIVPLPELSEIAILLQRMRIASRDFIGAEGDRAGRMTFEGQLGSLAADLDRRTPGRSCGATTTTPRSTRA